MHPTALRPRLLRRAALGSALVLAGVAVVPAAAAPPAPKPVTAVAHLTDPLSIAVTGGGALLVSENSLHTVVAKGKHRTQRISLGKAGDEIGGLSVSGGDLYAAWTPASGSARVVRLPLAGGRSTLVGDVGKHEASHNPDGGVTYGFRDLDPSCADQFGDEQTVSYTGGVEAHPFGTAVRGRTTYVADAGANAVLALRGGTVTTVAVLPAVPVEITAQDATGLGLPDCVVGQTDWFEPVPTDVEVGPDGDLYVTSLPGGPEDGSLGALGRVLRVDPRTGDVTVVATGFRGATGLAVRGNGDIYVAELFGNRVSRVAHGTSTPVRFSWVRSPAAVEIADGVLLVSADVWADGRARVVAFGL